MEQQEIRKSIEEILASDNAGMMATVKGNKPHVRYMTFYHEDLVLFTPTSKNTDKAEELAENPNTHILIGYGGEGYGDSYVDYTGTVTIKEDIELKKRLWNDHLAVWFNGPDDPKLIILQIEPTQIKLMNNKGDSPILLEL
ncbi:pyridoxamine 5'-phosphate oxidase family protein [Paucisalibacillus globulus]|uniref:pyridoxamine 5'-phosphate oxidase family protein n=1 Tax=Paucisalibacillus globulus TaxID=351095 RepID=UPI000405DF18|nr:pyridoxamine 5'-phosphate oxidase family protein [Paucisalibacillus globulus]